MRLLRHFAPRGDEKGDPYTLTMTPFLSLGILTNRSGLSFRMWKPSKHKKKMRVLSHPQPLIGKLQKNSRRRSKKNSPIASIPHRNATDVGKMKTPLKRFIKKGFLKPCSPVKVRSLRRVKQKESELSRGFGGYHTSKDTALLQGGDSKSRNSSGRKKASRPHHKRKRGYFL